MHCASLTCVVLHRLHHCVSLLCTVVCTAAHRTVSTCCQMDPHGADRPAEGETSGPDAVFAPWFANSMVQPVSRANGCIENTRIDRHSRACLCDPVIRSSSSACNVLKK